ncbi:MAG: sulfite exporter TauE/SafE family protein [Candidatus Bathyarchaeia archaeon]
MGPVLLLLMVAVGLLSGLVMSFVGASAVMVIVPSLNLAFGYGMHVAIGVSLLVDVIASLIVGAAYWRHGNVDLGQGLWIALGSVAGAQLGAGFTVGLPGWFLAACYGLWMMGSGAVIWKKGLDRTAIAERFRRYIQLDSAAQRAAVALVLGLGIGVNCGIFGAGGGILIMIVLIFLLDYPIHRAVGTSTVIMAVTAASAAVGYGLRGNIDVLASVVIAAGTVTGGVAGAHIANLTQERTLARIVGGIFIALGVTMTAFRLL